MFSADGLNHASPCVCKTDETKDGKSYRCNCDLFEDMVQQSIICVVVHALALEERRVCGEEDKVGFEVGSSTLQVSQERAL
jgi:hypothetical protein